MQITWHGLRCVRLQGKDVSVVMDPFGPDSGLKLSRSQADIVTISHEDMDAEQVPGQPFVIDIPGEYEVKGVFVYGIAWPRSKAKDDAKTMLYRVNIDDLSVGHIGMIDGVPEGSVLETLEGVDVLIISVGDDAVLSAKTAAEIVNIIEPRIVVPVNYHVSGVKAKLSGPEAFLKELGVKPESVDKLKIVKKDLPVDERRVYLVERT
ncbi:MAG: MBL fold metallo-hydrolase [Parcubacteria group bacterium]|nr:MBL fold metallo-hydrolase [Parcubacteria group bacterium]